MQQRKQATAADMQEEGVRMKQHGPISQASKNDTSSIDSTHGLPDDISQPILTNDVRQHAMPQHDGTEHRTTTATQPLGSSRQPHSRIPEIKIPEM